MENQQGNFTKSFFIFKGKEENMTPKEKHQMLEDNIENIAYQYVIEKKSSPEIAKQYNIDPTAIRNILKRHGYEIRKERCNSYRSLDIHVFDIIDTEEKAWALGFIAADGHITKKGNIVFSQRVSQKDALIKLSKILKSDAPINNKKLSSTFETGDLYCTYSVTSQYLGNKLYEMGLTRRKSDGYDFPKLISYIPKHLIHHFLRGLFDGDGSIKYYNYPYFKKTNVHVGFTHTLPAVEYWKSYMQINTKTVQETEFVYTAVTSNRFKAEEIYHKLYDDATVYIDIKKQTFEEFLDKFHQDEK